MKETIFRKNNIQYLMIAILLLVIHSGAHAQRRTGPVPDIQMKKSNAGVADYVHYTTVGQLGLTVTNFGIIGEGYNNPDQPSFMYKQYPDNIKEQVEHMSYGGLWIGGIVGDVKRVSTAIVDGVFDYGSEGFEFTDNGDSIYVRSSITTSRYYSPDAVSHQDFITQFHDMGPVVEHTPMNLEVNLQTHAWNYKFAEAFVILDYFIVNKGTEVIKDIYVGLWADAAVGNMNYTSIYENGGGWSWYDNQNGFDQSDFDPMPDDNVPGFPRNIAYQFDADGDNGYSESYVGFSCLGSETVPREYWDTQYNQWPWQAASNMTYPDYFMPVDDNQRYDKMKTSVPKGDPVSYPDLYTEDGYPSQPNSWMILISAGPFGTHPANNDSTAWDFYPGDTLNVVYAVGCGRWATNELKDSPERRELLRANLDWAQKAYNGEDSNGNGVLDGWEDQDGDGELDRYILPSPPPSPRLHIEVDAGKAVLYWDNSPEDFEDPISRKKDFEGYRIYARRKTSGIDKQWTLLGQIDKKNDIGFNSGLDVLRIRDEFGNPSYTVFGPDTFYYKFENTGILNGWPDKNVFSVTSYDTGDPATGLVSLESSTLENRTAVVAGKAPVEPGDEWVTGVYPNPYHAHAAWDGLGVRERMIWFYGLPHKATIRIFTIAGELIKTIDHDADTYNGADIVSLKDLSTSNTVYAGGEHAWDLITDYDQASATGLYLYSIEDKESGKIQTGRFLIIK